jgi:putative ABC transport system permease protein
MMAVPRPGLLWRLALKDLAYDWRPSAALMLAIVSVSAPLLLLFGLKTGMVTTMRDILVNDPRNMEIIIFENTQLPLAWFDRLRSGTDHIRFLIPRTRTLNTMVDLRGPTEDTVKSVEILPTAVDDPLIPKGLQPPVVPTDVLVTQAVAARLGVDRGDRVFALMKRTL